MACGNTVVTCYEAGNDGLGSGESFSARPRVQKDGSRTVVEVVVDPGDRKLSKAKGQEGKE